MLDVHAGEGGRDSRNFARELLNAYLKYASLNNLKFEIVYESDSSWSVMITGKSCLQLFRCESGKHVVTRIPETESRGRRHTSTVAVAVLPMTSSYSSNLPEQEVEIIRQRGHGKGGQHQNKVETAIRAIHKPTGISVFINGRSQHRNKTLALEILEARVTELKDSADKQHKSSKKARQIDYGTRSGKIRTYNYIRSFVVDHRTNKKSFKLDQVMKGRFDLIN